MILKKQKEKKKRLITEEENAKSAAERKKNFIITTTSNIQGQKIVRYLGIVSGEASIGTGIFSEISAATYDFLGDEAKGFTSKRGNVKNTAIERMEDCAISRGATAIVGVDIDIIDTGKNMFLACANGTTVVTEDL